MQVKVLGPIGVELQEPAALGGPTQRRVLAVLALHTGEVVSVDRLVDAVWPDGEAPERADHNVRSYVHRLRSALGDDGSRIETVGNGYRLRLERHELDAFRFEDLVADGRAAAARDEHDEARRCFEDALALWAGRPYDEFADEGWARAEVVRLDELRASAVEHRNAALLDAGRHTEVIGELRDAASEHPWREVRRMQLALALYRSGRQAEALQVLRDYRSQLVEELGLDPSPELGRLEHRILDHDPELLPPSHRRHDLRGYRLDEVVGEGAFALVWRGVQPSLARTVAVKQVRAELANHPDFVRRFETEAQTVAMLEHPYIVPLYDYWREPDGAYLVMRYVGGGSLESEVLQGGLDEPRLRRFVDQAGSALAAAHRMGVIHRDVKAANVLLDDDGNFYLTDFGIAFIGSAADDELATSLSTGSPAYASPEQLRRQALDVRTDIYGFGITLFEAATGRLPFVDAPTEAALVRRQLDEPVPAPSSVEPSVPPWVDEVVARATAKNPSDRYASMTELMAAAAPGEPTDLPHRLGTATVVGELLNPFKALRAFREADAADFFGRDRLISRFVEVLSQPGSAGRLLAVVGPSGSGKSSVVRSGLLPRLRRDAVSGSADWFITSMLPGNHPFDEFESALSRVAVRQPGPLVEIMRGDERGIARAVNQILPDEDSELLVVVDQFEELFTHGNDAERIAFVDGLVAAVREPRARLRVVLTIRADFWDRPLRHPGLASRLEKATVTVPPLAADELEAAIVEPVRRQGASYEPGLVARIMADVRDQPGALPLLQYALTELFDTHVSGLIRSESYDAIGGLTGALARRAEQTFTALSTDQQAAARRLFGRLVSLGEGTEDTRRRVRLGELGDDPDTTSVIAVFGDARLLVFDHAPATREPTVEVAHEALIRAWPRLRTWLDEDRDGLRIHRHLTETTAAWLASGRDDGELYRGGRLEAVREYADSAHLTEDEQAFLDASVAAADAEIAVERGRVRRLRRLAVATGIVAILAIGAGFVALGQQRRADDNAAEARAASARAETEAERANEAAGEAVEQAERAEDALADAEVVTLISRSATLVDENPAASLLLAAEAYDRDPSNRTTAALATALGARVGETLRVDLEPIEHRHCEDGHDSHTAYLPVSLDGQVGWHEGGTMTVLDPMTGETGVHTTQPDPCGGIYWDHSDGPVVHDHAGTVHVERQPGSGALVELLDLDEGARLWWATTSAGTDGVVSAAIITPSDDLDIHLFGRDDRPIAAPLELGIDAVGMSLAPSGRFGLAWERSFNEYQGHAIQLVDAEAGSALWRADLPGQMSGESFSPTDELVAVSDRGGEVHVFDTATGSLTNSFAADAGAVTSVAFLDDERLAIATADGVEVWNLTDGGRREQLITLRSAETVRALGPQQLSVVTADMDELVVLDLEQPGLGRRLADVPPGARVYLSPAGIAAIAAIAAAEGELIDLHSGETETHSLGVPDAGIVVGISPGDSTGEYLAFTIDGAIGAFENGELTGAIYLSDEPSLTIRAAAGHSTPEGDSRVAVHLSDNRPDSHEVFLVDLLTYEVVFSVVGECPCAGVTPTPDGQGLVLDTGDEVTVHTAEGGSRVLAAGSIDPLGNRIELAVDPAGNRILRGRPDGVIELIDIAGGASRVVSEFGVDVSLLAFIDATRAVVVTESGDVWLIDTEASERIGRVWKGGTADDTSGAPVVSADGDHLWVPTSSEIVEVPLSPDSWRELACELAGRDLTAEEWESLVPGDGRPRSLCPERN